MEQSTLMLFVGWMVVGLRIVGVCALATYEMGPRSVQLHPYIVADFFKYVLAVALERQTTWLEGPVCIAIPVTLVTSSIRTSVILVC